MALANPLDGESNAQWLDHRLVADEWKQPPDRDGGSPFRPPRPTLPLLPSMLPNSRHGFVTARRTAELPSYRSQWPGPRNGAIGVRWARALAVGQEGRRRLANSRERQNHKESLCRN